MKTLFLFCTCVVLAYSANIDQIANEVAQNLLEEISSDDQPADDEAEDIVQIEKRSGNDGFALGYSNNCGSYGIRIESESSCREAAKSLSGRTYSKSGNWPNAPKGCYTYTSGKYRNKIYWNRHGSGRSNSRTKSVCIKVRLRSCGRLRSGSCRGNSGFIVSRGKGHTVTSCRHSCSKTTNCKIFTFKKSGGTCELYREQAKDECRDKGYYDKRDWEMHHVNECEKGLKNFALGASGSATGYTNGYRDFGKIVDGDFSPIGCKTLSRNHRDQYIWISFGKKVIVYKIKVWTEDVVTTYVYVKKVRDSNWFYCGYRQGNKKEVNCKGVAGIGAKIQAGAYGQIKMCEVEVWGVEFKPASIKKLLEKHKCKGTGVKKSRYEECVNFNEKYKAFVCFLPRIESNGLLWCDGCTLYTECNEFEASDKDTIYVYPAQLRFATGRIADIVGYHSNFPSITEKEKTDTYKKKQAFLHKCLLTCQGTQGCKYITIVEADGSSECFQTLYHKKKSSQYGDKSYQVCPDNRFCPSRAYKSCASSACAIEEGNCASDSQCAGNSICGADSSCSNRDDRCCIAQTDPAYVRIHTQRKNYCSNADKCKEGEGVCNAHTDCEGDLKCGWMNCNWVGSEHTKTKENRCCYKPPASSRCADASKVTSVGTKLLDNACKCDSKNPCSHGEGSCRNDGDCAANHICGKTCPWNPFTSCCHLIAPVDNTGLHRCQGEENGCCTESKRCKNGDGHCSTDHHCEPGHVCGTESDCNSRVDKRANTRCCRPITVSDDCQAKKLCRGKYVVGFCDQCGKDKACCQKSSTLSGGQSFMQKVECATKNKGCDGRYCCVEVDAEVKMGIVGDAMRDPVRCQGNCTCTGAEVTYHADMGSADWKSDDKLGVIGVKLICTGGNLESTDSKKPCEECVDGYKGRTEVGAHTWTSKLKCPSGEHIIAMNTEHVASRGWRDDVGLIGIIIECSKGSELHSFGGNIATKYSDIRKSIYQKCDKITDLKCRCPGGMVVGLSTRYHRFTIKNDNYGVTDLNRVCKDIKSCAILRPESTKKVHDPIDIVHACALDCAAEDAKYMNIKVSLCECNPVNSNAEYELVKCPDTCNGCLAVAPATAKGCVEQIAVTTKTTMRGCLDKCVKSSGCVGIGKKDEKNCVTYRKTACRIAGGRPSNSKSYLKMIAYPKGGHYLEWGQWGPCNTKCGLGLQKRSRSCDTVTGIECTGEFSGTKTCQGESTTCTPRRTCDQEAIDKFDKEEFVATYELEKKKETLTWSKLKTFVTNMKIKLGNKCLVGARIADYCKSLRPADTPPSELGPIERDDPVCRKSREYDDIVLGNDKDAITSLIVNIEPKQVIQQIIDQKRHRDVLNKIEVKGNEILKATRELRGSMGNYFLALATYDERLAIEDMDTSIEEMNRLKTKFAKMDSMLAERLNTMVKAVFELNLLELIPLMANLVTVTVMAAVPMSGTGVADVFEAAEALMQSAFTTAQIAHLIKALVKHGKATADIKKKWAENHKFIDEYTKTLEAFRNQDFKDMDIDQICEKITELMAVYDGGSATTFKTEHIPPYVARVDALISDVCDVLNDNFNDGVSGVVKLFVLSSDHCSPGGMVQISSVVSVTLEDGLAHQETIISKLVDAGKAFVAKQMALKMVEGAKDKRSEKQLTRDIVMMQIKDMSYERKRMYASCDYWQFMNFGVAPPVCQDKDTINTKKLQDLMGWRPQFTQSSCRFSTKLDIYVPATAMGEDNEGIISLNDLRDKGESTFTIPEGEVEKYLQAYWFHANYMKGSNFFVQQFQLFLPWYGNQRRPLEVKVMHDPVHIMNGKKYLIKEKYKNDDGIEVKQLPHEMSVQYREVTKSCSGRSSKDNVIDVGNVKYSRDRLLPTLQGKWRVILLNNLPNAEESSRLKIPSDIMGKMYLRAKVTVCSLTSSSRKKRQVSSMEAPHSCCEARDELYQYNAKKKMFQCEKCPRGSKQSKDGFYCQDINECELVKCHGGAKCDNTIGGFRCLCGEKGTCKKSYYTVPGAALFSRTVKKKEHKKANLPSSLNCDFENGLCGWRQNGWTRIKGKTPSGGTGPKGDQSAHGYYIYFETSGKAQGSKVKLISSNINVGAPFCLSFSYHMYGRTMGTLKVRTSKSPTKSLFEKSGNQQSKWHNAAVLVDEQGPFQIIFEAIRGSNYQSDIALDDISFKDASQCSGASQAASQAANSEGGVKAGESVSLGTGCGKLRNGACVESSKHIISSLGTGFSVDSCRERCKSTSNCAIFLYNAELGACALYKATAEDGCTSRKEEKEHWAMYSVQECPEPVECDLKEKKTGTGLGVDIGSFGRIPSCIAACVKKGGNGVSIPNEETTDQFKCICFTNQQGQKADANLRNCLVKRFATRAEPKDDVFEAPVEQSTCTKGLASKGLQPSVRACAIQCGQSEPMVVFGRAGTTGCTLNGCKCSCVSSKEVKKGKCSQKADANYDTWKLKPGILKKEEKNEGKSGENNTYYTVQLGGQEYVLEVSALRLQYYKRSPGGGLQKVNAQSSIAKQINLKARR